MRHARPDRRGRERWTAVTRPSSIGLVGTLLLLLAACMHPSPAVPVPDPTPAWHYVPATARIAVATHRWSAAAVHGRGTRSREELRYTVRLTLQGDSTGLTADVVVDSVAAAAGWVPNEVERLRRARYIMALDQDGHRLDPPAEPTTTPLARLLPILLPVFPPGGLQAGTIWSDSAVTIATHDGTTLTADIVTTFHSPDAFDTDSVAINWSRTYTFHGEGEQMGQSFVVSGTGLGHGTTWVRFPGRFQATVQSDSTTAEMRVVDTDTTIPVIQVSVDTLQVIS